MHRIQKNPKKGKCFIGVTLFLILTVLFFFFLIVVHTQGKDRLFGFFVGKTLASSGGRADPVVINKVLKELLDAA